jgi:two-component system response regulator (stage 0 sporulation protein F)
MNKLEGKKILVVDDEEGIRDLIVSELEFCGAHCMEATNGLDAFELYKNENFDAVVSDVRMPNGDGLIFLNKIKDHNLPVKVIIFMTGFSEVPAEEIYDLGVEAIISKPFRLDHMVSTLEMAMVSPRVIWRRDPRIVSVLNIVVTLKNHASPISAKTFNIGRGGMFVQMTQPFPALKETVQFKMEYKNDEGDAKSITGDMIVRWVRKEPLDNMPPGFGGEFINMTPKSMDEIAGVAGLVKSRGFIPKS